MNHKSNITQEITSPRFMKKTFEASEATSTLSFSIDLSASGPAGADEIVDDDSLGTDEEFVILSDDEDDRICSDLSERNGSAWSPREPTEIEMDEKASSSVNTRTDLPDCLVQCLEKRRNPGKVPHQVGLKSKLPETERQLAIRDMKSLREVKEEEVLEFLKHGSSTLRPQFAKLIRCFSESLFSLFDELYADFKITGTTKIREEIYEGSKIQPVCKASLILPLHHLGVDRLCDILHAMFPAQYQDIVTQPNLTLADVARVDDTSEDDQLWVFSISWPRTIEPVNTTAIAVAQLGHLA